MGGGGGRREEKGEGGAESEAEESNVEYTDGGERSRKEGERRRHTV